MKYLPPISRERMGSWPLMYPPPEYSHHHNDVVHVFVQAEGVQFRPDSPKYF